MPGAGVAAAVAPLALVERKDAGRRRPRERVAAIVAARGHRPAVRGCLAFGQLGLAPVFLVPHGQPPRSADGVAMQHPHALTPRTRAGGIDVESDRVAPVELARRLVALAAALEAFEIGQRRVAARRLRGEPHSEHDEQCRRLHTPEHRPPDFGPGTDCVVNCRLEQAAGREQSRVRCRLASARAARRAISGAAAPASSPGAAQTRPKRNCMSTTAASPPKACTGISPTAATSQ